MKKLAADIGEQIDPEASQQLWYKIYVDDGVDGGSKAKVKVKLASSDVDEESLQLMGDRVLGHIWQPTKDTLW